MIFKLTHKMIKYYTILSVNKENNIMKKFILSSLLVLSSLSMICSAQSNGQMERRLKEEALPKDVSKYTLLVKIGYSTTHWVNKVSELMQDHYTAGPYEVLPYKGSISEAPYNDVTKFRYVILTGITLTNNEYKAEGEPTLNEGHNYFGHGPFLTEKIYLLDRSKKIIYYTGLDAQNMTKLLAFYADKLSGK